MSLCKYMFSKLLGRYPDEGSYGNSIFSLLRNHIESWGTSLRSNQSIEEDGLEGGLPGLLSAPP